MYFRCLTTRKESSNLGLKRTSSFYS
ncbi:hypothetical protein CEXT_731431, partial [Caerostris extrusa]